MKEMFGLIIVLVLLSLYNYRTEIKESLTIVKTNPAAELDYQAYTKP